MNASNANYTSDQDLEAQLDAELTSDLVDHKGSEEYRAFVELLLQRVKGKLPPQGVRSREFVIQGAVPRKEPYQGLVKTSEIFLRLENRIYGPLDDARLAELLTSGVLTGYESVTRDFFRWTPVAYHPRIMLSETVDPDLTHEALSEVSDLPAPAPKREPVPEDPRTAENPPLSVVFRKVKRPSGQSAPVGLVSASTPAVPATEQETPEVTPRPEILEAERPAPPPVPAAPAPEPEVVAAVETTEVEAPAPDAVETHTDDETAPAPAPAPPAATSESGSGAFTWIGILVVVLAAAAAVYFGFLS